MRAALERLEKRHGLDRLTRLSRQGVIVSYGVLIALLFLGGLQLQAQSDSGLMPMLVRILPLVLFLPSIVTRRPRGHAWLAFVSLLYFMQGVMIATLPDKAWLGMLEVVASLALFIASMFFARWRSRQLAVS
ncbi:DUF2069 domain-containing protein [Halomonas sp. McH1-25]|uniref:DUF2069 domain-containing protein n=1 Tax=unclassified Halomonas TaxID=2609666 RepID=UPI001EF50432|nr:MULTISPECIES: DUF2069 domain-containing protein [unclassified Halomonas]MCG7598446.1 DUF2069 domain-containing protein [Halomonas sp. McH1-25]MCP1343782.1 DUF2069 domain-containing protein [Halomonas sp. FL8]MCP1361387.1 DUF2069 domain-containing protein [Halomonas sp. BBD45]MCP1367852.1 DUF2069 domain-containing protein [Halomonas sp. BBD48]